MPNEPISRNLRSTDGSRQLRGAMRSPGFRSAVRENLAFVALVCATLAFDHASASALSPRDTGARYGQALGALEICHGARLTAAGDALRSAFAGSDNEVFKAQAAKIFDAWMAVKNCVNGRDPNQCKIIMDKSCAAAEAEIGENGSVMPGLLEFPARKPAR